ncbi:MAG TPA: tetratricopeptide repeat protein, partial [Blastocatellia bacterium]|nr:tetratricopeptide repeat protein [Blastocatellia bacterium]
TSAILKYDNLELEPIAAGREQGVDSLLEGSIQRSGARIRVSVQLVRVSDTVPLWAGNFDEDFTDIFKLQDSISEQVTRALLLKLTGEEERLIRKRYTESTEAYRLYMKGRFHWGKFNEQGLTKAIEYFNQALELDPNYALAYVGLSISYNVQGAIGVRPPREVWQKAKFMAEKAAALDNDLAEAHLSLGAVSLVYGWEWSVAEKELKRAIELNPNYGEAYELYGYYLQATGQVDEAVTETIRAQDLDPLSAIISSDLGFAYYYARRYDEAIAAHWKAKELDPKSIGSQFLLGQAYAQRGLYSEGIIECQKEISSAGRDPRIEFSLAYNYAKSGKRAEAEKLASELSAAWERRYFPPFLMAIVYAGLENSDRALEWLDKAYDARDPQLIWVKVEPGLDRLHSDHRFKELLQRMGLAH